MTEVNPKAVFVFNATGSTRVQRCALRVEPFSNELLARLRRGGQEPQRVTLSC